MSILGSLTVITGSMFAGKSEELIRRLRRAEYAKKKVQVFKHAIDARFDFNDVCTHEGKRLTAVPVHDVEHMKSLIEDDTEVIGIEEAQFFDAGLTALCVELADRGKTVLVAGLDQNFRREPFGCMPELMAVADDVIKLRAICMKCGREASHTQRLVEGEPVAWDDPLVVVGAMESYEARCRLCHVIAEHKSSKPSDASDEPQLPFCD